MPSKVWKILENHSKVSVVHPLDFDILTVVSMLGLVFDVDLLVSVILFDELWLV